MGILTTLEGIMPYLEEAGGRVTNLKGREFNILSGDIAASNGRIHEEMLQVLKTSSPHTSC